MTGIDANGGAVCAATVGLTAALIVAALIGQRRCENERREENSWSGCHGMFVNRFRNSYVCRREMIGENKEQKEENTHDDARDVMSLSGALSVSANVPQDVSYVSQGR